VGSGRGAYDDGSRAAWSTPCDPTGFGRIDPILNFGGVSAHMHTFAGQPGPSSTMTPDSLQNDPVDTTCQSPKIDGVRLPDKSEYWVPSLYADAGPTPDNDGITPNTVLVYYRNADVDPATIQAFPHQLSFIAGDSHATEDQPTTVVDWSCVAKKRHDGIVREVNFGTEIPETCPMLDADGDPYVLRLVVYFPNCISLTDDVDSNTDQYNPNVAGYAIDDGTISGDYPAHCVDPKTAPIPQVQVGFRWPLNAAEGLNPDPTDPTLWDLRPMHLASDNMPLDGGGTSGDHGMTAHMDFMSGWSESEIATLLANCYYGTPHNCGTIGDGGN
jgi:uncharacterized protein DUF1996